MDKKSGTLYGIGVGPGDPELLTLKAVNILNRVDVIFTASSTKNSFSLAVQIAEPHIPEGAEIRVLSFPMTSDKRVMEEAWAENARIVAEAVSGGRAAAFLTLGDPLTYSTFGYVLRHLQSSHPEVPVETIPGITSYQAAASRLNTPLVEGEESLLITSGAYGGENVRKAGKAMENVVLLKAYKNVADITEALDEADLLTHSKGISKCGRADEEVYENLRELAEKKPDYWTLIIAKQGKPNGKFTE